MSLQVQVVGVKSRGRVRRLLATAAAALALLAVASAEARADSATISGLAPAGQYEVSATFTVTKDSCDPRDCFWFALARAVAPTAQCSPSADPVWVSTPQERARTITETDTFMPLPPGKTGPVKLCVQVYDNGVHRTVAEMVFTFPLPPAPAPGVDQPIDADLIKTRLYGSGGLKTNRTRFYISTSPRPATVGLERWEALVRVAASRWGMKVVGRRTGTPVFGNGINEVGFGAVKSDALAVQVDTYTQTFRVTRRCRIRAGRRVCFNKRVLVRRKLRDRDIRVSRSVVWQPGPAKPSPDEYDLQTVLLHEMGHMAGNARHASRCANSPMIVSLDKGEWWHGPNDRFVRCENRGTAAKASAASAPRIDRTTVTITLDEPTLRAWELERARVG